MNLPNEILGLAVAAPPVTTVYERGNPLHGIYP
jgi:hypothetical protein